MLFTIEELGLERKKKELDWYYFFSGEDSKFYMEPSTRYYDFDNHNFKR